MTFLLLHYSVSMLRFTPCPKDPLALEVVVETGRIERPSIYSRRKSPTLSHGSNGTSSQCLLARVHYYSGESIRQFLMAVCVGRTR